MQNNPYDLAMTNKYLEVLEIQLRVGIRKIILGISINKCIQVKVEECFSLTYDDDFEVSHV
jgi:hypothetical protein